MKKIIFIISVLAVLFSSAGSQNRPDLLSWYDGPVWQMQTDTGITCSPGGIIRDDGTYENGYQCVTTCDSSSFVQKMVVNGPFNITTVCVTWTRTAAGSVNRTYDLVIYDTLGAGGAPGNLIARIVGVTANNVAIFPAHSRHRHDITPVGISGRTCYVGVRLNNQPPQNVYISADENGFNAGQPGYERSGTGFPATWVLIPPGIGGFPNWKNFGIRLEGTAGGSGGQQYTFCRGGLSISIPEHNIVRDSIQVILNQGCIVSDVNVIIDTVIHTWNSDLRFYLEKGTTGIMIINRAGGSSDNFIHTVLNDSAATPISSGFGPFTGSFRPQNPMTPLFAGQSAAGYWRLAISDSTAGDTGHLRRWCVVITGVGGCFVGGIHTVEIPNHYILEQNYPNPFNPVTTIKYGLPENSFVKLVVYDILGREVKVLVNEYKTANTYEVEFDASALTSGVYFYRLEANDYSITKKMLLIK